jgi:hypothetical protein
MDDWILYGAVGLAAFLLLNKTSESVFGSGLLDSSKTQNNYSAQNLQQSSMLRSVDWKNALLTGIFPPYGMTWL